MEDIALEEEQKQQILTVRLDLNNPFDIVSDLNGWQAYDFFGFANMHIVKTPFKSPDEMFVMEQRELAKNAFKYLKAIGFDKETIQDIARTLCPQFMQCVQKDTTTNKEILSRMRDMSLGVGIDALTYQNDYECQDGCDNTCYLVLNPDAITIMDRNFCT